MSAEPSERQLREAYVAGCRRALQAYMDGANRGTYEEWFYEWNIDRVRREPVSKGDIVKNLRNGESRLIVGFDHDGAPILGKPFRRD
jgi:hypothetical protein